MASQNSVMVLAFGLLGNIISFLVGLAPAPTFYHMYKKKSAAGYQSIPYVTALFSAMLWIYYALIKEDQVLLITINAFCCLIQSLYIAIYLCYATKKDKILTSVLVLLIDVLGFGLIVLSTVFLGMNRVQIVGYICMAISLIVFAAPLCIIRTVIRTQSVEFMPLSLSFFPTLSSITWFCYGFLLKDMNIAIPNVLGFILGVLQVLIYFIYKNRRKSAEEESKEAPLEKQKNNKLHELSEHIVDIVKIGTTMCSSERTTIAPQLSDASVKAKLGNCKNDEQDNDVAANQLTYAIEHA